MTPQPLCPLDLLHQSDHIAKRQEKERALRQDERHQRLLYDRADLDDIGAKYGPDLEESLFAAPSSSSSSFFSKTRSADLREVKMGLRDSLASHQKKLWNLPDSPALRHIRFKTEKGTDLWSLACYHHYMDSYGMDCEHRYTTWFFDTFLSKDYMQFEKDEQKYKEFVKLSFDPPEHSLLENVARIDRLLQLQPLRGHASRLCRGEITTRAQ